MSFRITVGNQTTQRRTGQKRPADVELKPLSNNPTTSTSLSPTSLFPFSSLSINPPSPKNPIDGSNTKTSPKKRTLAAEEDCDLTCSDETIPLEGFETFSIKIQEDIYRNKGISSKDYKKLLSLCENLEDFIKFANQFALTTKNQKYASVFIVNALLHDAIISKNQELRKSIFHFLLIKCRFDRTTLIIYFYLATYFRNADMLGVLLEHTNMLKILTEKGNSEANMADVILKLSISCDTALINKLYKAIGGTKFFVTYLSVNKLEQLKTERSFLSKLNSARQATQSASEDFKDFELPPLT